MAVRVRRDDKEAVNSSIQKFELFPKQRLRCRKSCSCEFDDVDAGVDEVDVIVKIGRLRRAFRVSLVSKNTFIGPEKANEIDTTPQNRTSQQYSLVLSGQHADPSIYCVARGCGTTS